MVHCRPAIKVGSVLSHSSGSFLLSPRSSKSSRNNVAVCPSVSDDSGWQSFVAIMMPMPPMRGGSQLASPQADQSIPPAPAPGADISSLLGGGPPAAAMTPNANDLKQAFLEQVRTMSQSAQALAQQYPAFAPFSEAIVKAAQEGMVAVISQLAAQTPSPNPLALM